MFISPVRSERLPNSIATLFEDFDYVVNCAGFSGCELGNEPSDYMALREGIVVKVAPTDEITGISLMHTGNFFGAGQPFYIVPRRGPGMNDILLGGTITDARSGTPIHVPWPAGDPRIQETAERIRAICISFAPSLADVAPRDISVGYRPARDIPVEHRGELEPPYGVRLDVETTSAGTVIHNYGHGGGGVTFSWGCARHVLELLEEQIAHAAA